MDAELGEDVNWLQDETCGFDIPEGMLSPNSPSATSTLIQEEDDDDCEVFFGPVTEVEIQRHVEVIKKEPLESDKLSNDQLTMLQKESEAVSLMLQSNKKIKLPEESLWNSQKNITDIVRNHAKENSLPEFNKQITLIPTKSDAIKRRGIPVMAQQNRTLKMPTPRTDLKQKTETSQLQQPTNSTISQLNNKQRKSVTSINRPKNTNLIEEEKRFVTSALPKLASRIAIPATSRLPKANSGLIAPRRTASTGCGEATPRLTKSTSGKVLPRRSIINSLRNSETENNTKSLFETKDLSKSSSPQEKRISLFEANESGRFENNKTNKSPEQKTENKQQVLLEMKVPQSHHNQFDMDNENNYQDCKETSIISDKTKKEILIKDISDSSETDNNHSPLKESKPITHQIINMENQINEECLLSLLPIKNKENIPQHIIDSPLLKFSPLQQQQHVMTSKHDPFSTGTTPPSLITLSPELKPQPIKISNLIEF